MRPGQELCVTVQYSAGTILADRYVLERELGHGGMATVWLARDRQHDRAVAVKILKPDIATAVGVDRFLREVRIASRLQHRNIVPILDSGVLQTTDHALPWCVMAYIDGESLRARLTREPQLPIDDAMRITREVADALHAAHSSGIVHRDLKPENVLLAGERVYVLDFGIAKALDDQAEQLTSTGMAIGTPAYMSPEQSLGSPIDARSDQYGLATMLYEMLAGEPPFAGPNVQVVVARRLAEPARPLRNARSTVPSGLEAAVLRALERAPADRYHDLPAFIAALESGDARSAPRNRRVLRRAGALVVLGAVTAVLWAPVRAQFRPSPRAELAMLHQRGVREYERRTPESVAQAVAAFNAILAQDSAYAPAWTGLAKAYVRADERAFHVPGVAPDALIRRAVQAADRGLALDSTNADAWLTVGIVQMRLDATDLRAARRASDRAIQLDASLADAWHFRARILAESGHLDSALMAWRVSVRLAPRYAQGLSFLALAHYWRHDFDSAAVWADSAAAVEPAFFLARLTAGQVAVERGEFEKARAAFDAAGMLGSDIEAANVAAHHAIALARSGQRASAIRFLERADSIAAALAPPSLHTTVYLAQAYAAIGNETQALRLLERATPRGNLHFQLHLRCDPPLDALRRSSEFRALLVPTAATPPGGRC
jgi:tetratricopeptide (TPR) repeat protein/predicted Ser/Thr protein kinase